MRMKKRSSHREEAIEQGKPSWQTPSSLTLLVRHDMRTVVAKRCEPKQNGDTALPLIGAAVIGILLVPLLLGHPLYRSEPTTSAIRPAIQ